MLTQSGRLCVAKTSSSAEGSVAKILSTRMAGILPSSRQSKQFVNKPNLGHDIVLRHAPDSPLAEEVHHLDSLEGAPGGAERTVAHRQLHSSFQSPVVL